MNRVPEQLKVPGPQRWALGLSLGLCGLSGLLWLALERLQGPSGEFLLSWKQGSLAFHAALGAIVLLVLGSYGSHLRAALGQARNRASGWALLALWGLVLASAWALYYGPAESRVWASRLHWIPGLFLMFAVLLHAWLGRRSRPRTKAQRRA